MSNENNSQLFERASDMITYFEGTVVAKVIEKNMEDNDLDALAVNVLKAENQVSQAEFAAAEEEMEQTDVS